jgi:hypothetical protein
LSALPWGLSAVWDQAFRYHLEAAGSRTPVANLGKVAATLAGRDLPLMIAATAVGLAALAGRRRERPPGTVLIGAWLIATVAVLALEHPLWRNHVAHLVPPLALLVVAGAGRLPAYRPHLPAGLGLALLLAAVAPYHLLHNAGVLRPRPPTGAEAAAHHQLADLPAGAWAISDDPGLVWRAGRRTPPDLVDTSVLRLDSGRITAASLARAAAEPQVCGLLVWSERFGRLSDLPTRLEGYRVAARYGGPRVLYVKDACSPRIR